VGELGERRRKQGPGGFQRPRFGRTSREGMTRRKSLNPMRTARGGHRSDFGKRKKKKRKGLAAVEVKAPEGNTGQLGGQLGTHLTRDGCRTARNSNRRQRVVRLSTGGRKKKKGEKGCPPRVF